MRKLLCIIASASAIWLTSVVAAPTASAVDVYTTPGQHHSGGRLWNTQCEHYSGEIVRCRTDIHTDGGWVFNNLTYFGGTKDVWAGNPLATDGEFTSGGRQWRTSCGDDWTGPNGCRTFVKQDGQWVFNNVTGFRDPQAAAPAIPNTKIQPLERPATPARPAATGKEWKINSVGVAKSQRDIDACKGPMLWKGRQHVAAHNYCNNWAANAWHDMKAGDTLVLTMGGETIRGAYSHDFSVPYGKPAPAHEGSASGDTIWVQVSWPDEVRHDTNHVIVFTKIS